MKCSTVLIFLLALGTILCNTPGTDNQLNRCKKKKKFYGCRYDPSLFKCVCWSVWACHDANPFTYYNEKNCNDHVNIQQGACKRFPCQHGTCKTEDKSNKFSCDCTGTDFYGKRCQKPCPKRSDLTIDFLEKFLYKDHWESSPVACIL